MIARFPCKKSYYTTIWETRVVIECGGSSRYPTLSYIFIRLAFLTFG